MGGQSDRGSASQSLAASLENDEGVVEGVDIARSWIWICAPRTPRASDHERKTSAGVSFSQPVAEADPRSAQCLLRSSSPSPTTPPSHYHPRFSSSDVMQQSAGPGSALRALQSAMKLSEPTSTRTNPLPPHSRARAVRYQINTTPEKMHASATSNAVRVFPDDLASQSKDRGQLAPGYQSVLISWLESSAFAFSGVRRRWQSPCAPGNLRCACFGDWHSRDMQSFC